MGKHFSQKNEHKGPGTSLSRVRWEYGWSTVDEEKVGTEREK